MLSHFLVQILQNKESLLFNFFVHENIKKMLPKVAYFNLITENILVLPTGSKTAQLSNYVS